MFFLSQWLMPGLLAWAAQRMTFNGSRDLVTRLTEFGPFGMAGLVFLGVFGAGRIWIERTAGQGRDGGGPGPVGLTKPVVEQVIFGAIPHQARWFQQRPETGQLRGALDRGRGIAFVAIVGARGVGKSQLAADYARECAEASFGLVAWIDAEGGAVPGLAQLAQRLGGSHGADFTSEELAEQVRPVLERRDGVARLVVFDNAESPFGLARFLPAIGTAQVIVTSSRQDFTMMPEVFAILLDMYTPEQGRRFLAEATGLPNQADATELGEVLGWLPLALAQAAAYIRGNALDYRQYLAALARLDLDEMLVAQAGIEHPGVLRAIRLGIVGLAKDDPSGFAARLIAMLSRLSADGVSRELLTSSPVLLALGVDATAMARALRVLTSSSLVTLSVRTRQPNSPKSAVVAVHRLTARVLRYEASLSVFPSLADGTAMLLTLSSLFPLSEVARQRRELDELTAHITTLRRHAEIPAIGLADLYNWAGRALHTAGDLNRAILMLQSAQADYEQLLGSRHLQNLKSRSDLAAAYRSAGRFDEAITLYRAVVAQREQQQGVDQPDTLKSHHDLAYTYRSAGRFHEAIPIYQAVLASRKQVLGADHPDTLKARNSLAYTYGLAGRLDRAIVLHEAVVADYERVLGPDHRDTLKSRNNLAGAYESAGRLDQAILLHQAVLNDRERVLGADHPDTLDSRHDLAYTLRSAGRFDEAIALYQAVLADRERVLGADHRHTLDSRNNLAYGCRSGGRLDEAIDLYHVVAIDSERVLGADHPNTLDSRYNLAYTHELANHLDDAVSLYRAVLADCERALDPTHPLTTKTREQLDQALKHTNSV
jgi:tetratricopeptide (TPR) repeat protein